MGPKSRIALRYSVDFSTSTIIEAAELFGYDYDLTMVYLIINLGATDPLHNVNSKYASFDQPLAVDIQRPISRRSVSRITGLPRETVRRKVNQLLALGLIVSVGNAGLVSSSGVMQQPTFSEKLEKVYNLTLRLVAKLVAIENLRD